MSVTCSPSGSGSGSSSKKLPVRPLGDLNTVKNQDGLSSDGDVLPLASFFLPVFRVAADIFARKPGCYQVHQVGRLAPDSGLAVRRRSLRSHGDERRRRGAQKALTDDSPATSRSNPPVIPLHDAGRTGNPRRVRGVQKRANPIRLARGVRHCARLLHPTSSQDHFFRGTKW